MTLPHWVRHRWGPWGPVKRYLVRVGRRTVEVYGSQSRVCLTCGKSQITTTSGRKGG